MKIKHIHQCPICCKDLRQDKVSPLSTKGKQNACQVFICCEPLVEDPLHYYSHVVCDDEPDWIFQQEFSVNIGSRYVMFYNDYQIDRSWIKSNVRHTSFSMPALLIPDFPIMDTLKRKIKLAITFS